MWVESVSSRARDTSHSRVGSTSPYDKRLRDQVVRLYYCEPKTNYSRSSNVTTFSSIRPVGPGSFEDGRPYPRVHRRLPETGRGKEGDPRKTPLDVQSLSPCKEDP